MHMYDRIGGEKLLFTNMDDDSASWLQGEEGPRLGAVSTHHGVRSHLCVETACRLLG
jgi:hypothetical protein